MADPKTANEAGEVLKKTLDALIQVLLRAKTHLALGRGLGMMITDEPEISHAAPTFWSLTIYAHLDATQLLAFKLFDKRPEAVTIERLLCLSEKNPEVFANASPAQLKAVVDIARNQIAGLKAPLKAIHAKRNRFIAHLEQTVVLDPVKAEKTIQVTFSDLNYVFSIAASILNDVGVAFRDTSPMFDAIGVEDFKNIGDLIVEAKCERIRKYESEFGTWPHSRPKKCG